MLTSLGVGAFSALFDSSRTGDDAGVALARVAAGAGIGGVVGSARELPAIRAQLGSGLKVVTPGIRLTDGPSADDQARVVTPERAVRDGADWIVVGRPVIAARESGAAAGRIIGLIATA